MSILIFSTFKFDISNSWVTQPHIILALRFDNVTNFVTSELSSLHDRQGNPLPLDELYLDTTFCSPLYKTFPTREEAQEEIWRLCKKWVTKESPA